jgi:putative transposase
VKRSFRYRLKPNRQQARSLSRILEVHRQLYNAALQERREAWRMCRVSVTYCMQANQLKELRSFDEDVAFLNYSSCQQTLRRLDKAFRAFFRRLREGQEPGYPRFKGRRRFKSASYVYGDGIKLKDGRLYVQNVGRVRIRLHRPLPEGATIKQVVLRRTGTGEWYATFQIELPEVPVERHTGPAVGIDLGLEHFAALSTGELVPNPRWFRESEAALARVQRQRSRCRRCSRRYHELSRRITRLHEKIARQRRDFQHKLSRRLTGEFSLIAVERLSVQGLARSRLAKSVHDAAWSQFLFFLGYKGAETGSQVIEVAANGTSQECACCGCVVPKSLSEREHVCPSCGFTAPRDVNAALNILFRGTARAEPPRKGLLLPVGLKVSISQRAEVAGSRRL